MGLQMSELQGGKMTEKEEKLLKAIQVSESKIY